MEFFDRAKLEFRPRFNKENSRETLTEQDVESPREYFLRLLEKDDLERIFCYNCQIIHHPNRSEFRIGIPSHCCQCDFNSVAFYKPKFTFSRAKIALKSHRISLASHTQRHLNTLVFSMFPVHCEFATRLNVAILNDRLRVTVLYQRWIARYATSPSISVPLSNTFGSF
jgi:hypothetical protein